MEFPITVRKKFATRVRRLRCFHGWSQERLAEISGIHRSYIGAIERAERNVSLEYLERLADALGVKISELLDFESDMQHGRNKR